MKTISCSEVGGGECTAKFSDEIKEGMKGQISAHAKEVHVDMMAKATPDSMEEWNKKFDQIWDDAPEDGAETAINLDDK